MIDDDDLAVLNAYHDRLCPYRDCEPMTYAHLLEIALAEERAERVWDGADPPPGGSNQPNV